MHDAIIALTNVLSTEYGRSERVDWDAVLSAWGTKFPSDYMEFMSIYGAGSINNSVFILNPPATTVVEFSSSVEEVRSSLLLQNEFQSIHHVAFPESNGLIRWATDFTASDVYWQVVGADPDEWPVVVFSRGRGEWVNYPVGMAKFLCMQVARPDFERPLDMVDSVDGKPIRFVNCHVESELEKICDPWPDLQR